MGRGSRRPSKEACICSGPIHPREHCREDQTLGRVVAGCHVVQKRRKGSNRCLVRSEKDPCSARARQAATPLLLLARVSERLVKFAGRCASIMLQQRQLPILEPINIFTQRGGRRLQYVWDGKSIKAVPVECTNSAEYGAGRLLSGVTHLRSRINAAFYPPVDSVSEDYWEFIKWRQWNRFWATSMKLLGTQSLLMALGIGSTKSLAASATMNWIMRDGLGKMTRMAVAMKYGSAFDSNLKRARFQASMFFAIAVGVELLSPTLPKHFLLLSSIANVGHAISMTVYTSTAPALAASFCENTSIAVLTAKSQARRMVVDSAALAAVAAFTHAFKDSMCSCAGVAYPFCAAMLLLSTRNELRSLELRTLNSERLGILAKGWVQDKGVLSPQSVSQMEGLWGIPRSQVDSVPTTIGTLEDMASTPLELMTLMQQHQGDKYMVALKEGPQSSIRLCLRQDAQLADITAAFLHVAHMQQQLHDSYYVFSPRDAHLYVQNNSKRFMRGLTNNGWVTHSFCYAGQEQQGYVY